VQRLSQLIAVCLLADVSVVLQFFSQKDITGIVVRQSNMGLKQFEFI